jgi:archaellum biogenesis protein FlaJ (TadC family)
VLRECLAEIPPKHEKEIDALISSYKDQYRNWLFELRSVLLPMLISATGAISISFLPVLVLNVDPSEWLYCSAVGAVLAS